MATMLTLIIINAMMYPVLSENITNGIRDQNDDANLEFNLLIDSIYKKPSINIKIEVVNHGSSLIYMSELELYLDTIDFTIITPNGDTIHYIGGTIKRLPSFIKLSPNGHYIQEIDLTKYEFGNNEIGDYSFFEHPGTYKIVGHLWSGDTSSSHDVWNGHLQTNEYELEIKNANGKPTFFSAINKFFTLIDSFLLFINSIFQKILNIPGF